MNVDGVGKIRSTTTPKVGAKQGGGSGDFSRLIDSDKVGPSEVSGVQAPAAIDALLALQEVDDATERRAKAKKRANNILDRLDEIRHGLLMGSISPHNLQQLRSQIASEHLDVDDPQLKALLDEIDLRAQVELAKLEMGQQGNFA